MLCLLWFSFMSDWLKKLAALSQPARREFDPNYSCLLQFLIGSFCFVLVVSVVFGQSFRYSIKNRSVICRLIHMRLIRLKISITCQIQLEMWVSLAFTTAFASQWLGLLMHEYFFGEYFYHFLLTGNHYLQWIVDTKLQIHSWFKEKVTSTVLNSFVAVVVFFFSKKLHGFLQVLKLPHSKNFILNC